MRVPSLGKFLLHQLPVGGFRACASTLAALAGWLSSRSTIFCAWEVTLGCGSDYLASSFRLGSMLSTSVWV